MTEIAWRPEPRKSAVTRRIADIDAGDATQVALRSLADMLDADDSLMLVAVLCYSGDDGLVFEAILDEAML